MHGDLVAARQHRRDPRKQFDRVEPRKMKRANRAFNEIAVAAEVFRGVGCERKLDISGY
jgi:hypothetical protein